MRLGKLTVVCVSIIMCLLCCVAGRGALAAEDDRAAYEAIDRQLSEDVERYHIPAMAVAVVDKDTVLFEQTYGECERADEPFIIGSMSKSFTAAAIMQLVEQGSIALDSSVDEYIDASEWFSEGTNHGRITIRDLLNHTSGIPTYQTFGFLESTDSYGSHVYANANYGLLGLVIESVSGLPYEDYIERNIFDPLGMSHSAATLEQSKKHGLIDGYRNFFGIPVAGEPDYPGKIQRGTWESVPAGFLSSSVADMEAYLQMYLRGGEQVLSTEGIDRMFYENVPAGDGTHYGMGWIYETERYSQPVLMHPGLVENYTSNMVIIPDKGIAVVMLVNMNDYLVGNNLLENVILPLLGERRQELPNLYLILHAVIDAACLALCLVSLQALFSLRRWKARTGDTRQPVLDILRHLVLPMALLAAPLLMGVPYKVVWLFVKDLAAVMALNVAVLAMVGVYKATFLLKKTTDSRAAG